MTHPLLALCAIVRDEAHCITRTLESVHGIVDAMTIIDTGSTDGTQDILRRTACQHLHDPTYGRALPIYEEPFVDYATMRNRALVLEAGVVDAATWCLSLSADETLHGGEALRAFLETSAEDALLVEVRTPSGSFDYPRVLRTSGRFRYVGAIHEEPRHLDDPARIPHVKIPGVWITYAPTDPVRLAARLRERDMPLLRQQLAAALPKTEARARALVLLAQTQEQIAEGCTDSVEKTLETLTTLGWYVIAAVQEGVFFAQWKALNVSETLGLYKPREMLERVKELAQRAPADPAVAYMLAAALVNAGDLKEGLKAAQRAAGIARAAVVDPEHPHDPHGLLWRTHHIAALCAKRLGHRREDVRRAVEAGLAAGGPAEVFADLTR